MSDAKIAYRGEGHKSLPGCDVRGHYVELQAICDALGFAAQKIQSGYVETRQEHLLQAGKDLASDNTLSAQIEVREARADDMWSLYWYGVFQGLRGFLRALEGNTSELHALEQEMLSRIDWSVDPPHFVVPGFEDVKLEDQHLPGDETVGATQLEAVG